MTQHARSEIQGVPKKRNDKIVRFCTLFWPFFDLLMTLTPYKHLIEYYSMF